ncbi:3'(2'), 5'-bisphosphate nucleotidase [Pseudomonas lini]|jgi:3'(2'), 5'-bisphosphate nucleotidase|uniref:3'(2'),5'-bisphosphate nucleotidase CysQ n=1 Tax=Pseudomonas lini TaxID=163011 RepID=UPI002784D5BB|nr:3'(2'),5'-bisphosphate nucleotidase CysQ [Pseudomonas lini]MDQ0124912.1 3'(2'), 5'-bisphosphate nucleotidase [Pseudomonas lini]
MSESILDDAQLASRLAIAAGEHLLRLREHGLLPATCLGAHGDRLANTLLTDLLRRHRPDDGLLSEEEAADEARLSRRRVWIVDPLDGTREYAEGRADWAVHVGLVKDGVADVACAVCLPALDQTFSGAAPPALPAALEGPLKILVSRTRAPRIAEQVAQRLGAQLIPMGSAGAKAMAVVRGEAHAYLHAGGQYEWDSCAPVGVALAAGLHASRIDGSPCRYNQTEVFMPDLLICRPELAASLLSTIAECLRHEEFHHV